jgi:hypothetical protein
VKVGVKVLVFVGVGEGVKVRVGVGVGVGVGLGVIEELPRVPVTLRVYLPWASGGSSTWSWTESTKK